MARITLDEGITNECACARGIGRRRRRRRRRRRMQTDEEMTTTTAMRWATFWRREGEAIVAFGAAAEG